jgi:hypothetical protein
VDGFDRIAPAGCCCCCCCCSAAIGAFVAPRLPGRRRPKKLLSADVGFCWGGGCKTTGAVARDAADGAMKRVACGALAARSCAGTESLVAVVATTIADSNSGCATEAAGAASRFAVVAKAFSGASGGTSGHGCSPSSAVATAAWVGLVLGDLERPPALRRPRDLGETDDDAATRGVRRTTGAVVAVIRGESIRAVVLEAPRRPLAAPPLGGGVWTTTRVGDGAGGWAGVAVSGSRTRSDLADRSCWCREKGGTGPAAKAGRAVRALGLDANRSRGLTGCGRESRRLGWWWDLRKSAIAGGSSGRDDPGVC